MQRIYQTSKDHKLHQEWIQRVGTSEIVLVGVRHLLRPGVESFPHHTMIAASQGGQTHVWEVLGKIVNNHGTTDDQEVEKDDPLNRRGQKKAGTVFTPLAISEGQNDA